MKRLLAAVAVIGAALYPLIVYFGLTRFEPRYLAAFAGLLLLLKVMAGSVPALVNKPFSPVVDRNSPVNAVIGGIVFGLVVYAFFSNEVDSLKLYPVVISFSLLATCGWSLVYPPTIIEKIARITEPDLPAAGVRYTRRITLVWCGFFVCNGLIALYTSLFASFKVWTLYNGLISYLLMACLLSGEIFYRHSFLKKG